MRASALKYWIISVMATLTVTILFLMPLHAFLTVWGSSLIGHYTALRLWKETLLLICVIGLLYLLLFDQKTRGHTLARLMVWLIVAYSVLNILWGLVALKWGDVSLKAFGYGLIVDLRFPVFFLVTWATAARTNRLRAHWQRLVFWPAVVVIAFGLLQVFVLPNDFLSHFGYGPNTILPFETINHNPQYVRIFSTLRGSNPLGAYLLVPISLCAVYIARGKRDWKYLALFLGGIITLYFSFSRSAWIGAAISVSIVLLISYRTKIAREWFIAGACVAVVAVGLLAFGLRHNVRFENIFFHTQQHSAVATTSDESHLSAMKRGVSDMVHEPLGKGPGTAGPASVYNNHPARIAENFYIQIGQETGWLGLALFLLFNAGVGYLLWLRRKEPLAASLFASLIGLSFINMLSHAWADDTLAYVWWGLAGIAMAPYDHSKESKKSS